MKKADRDQHKTPRALWRSNYRNADRQNDWSRQQRDAGHAYESDYTDSGYDSGQQNNSRKTGYNKGNSYDTTDRNYNHDIRAGHGTGSYHGGSYEGGYSNSDYRDNDINQRYDQSRNTSNEYGRYDRSDRGFSRDYNQSRFGQASTYGLYGNQGSSSSYNTGSYGSGGSHFSSDYDRYNRAEVAPPHRGGQTNSESFRGKGPKGYQRSDERIKEDINDRLSDSHEVDATEIEVTVDKGEVILSGTVAQREQKRKAEDIAESVSGVKNVENRIRLS
jgi:hypothetical protein